MLQDRRRLLPSGSGPTPPVQTEFKRLYARSVMFRIVYLHIELGVLRMLPCHLPVSHLQAVPLLASTIGLLLGFIFITGLTGVQLYSDSFHFACINDVTGELEPWESDVQGFTWGCGGSRLCPANFTCADLPGSVSLSENLAGFDNVGAAMLTAFQVSMLARWCCLCIP